MDAKMLRPEFYWDMDDDPDGNVVHIAEHDLTPDEVESVFSDRRSVASVSRSSGRPLVFGWTNTGRHIAIAYDEVNDDPLAIYVITAYDVELNTLVDHEENSQRRSNQKSSSSSSRSICPATWKEGVA